MKPVFSAPFFILGGALAGVASAYLATQTLGLTGLAGGSPWQARNVAASALVHPYTIAYYLLGGRLPPSGGPFVEFTASTDDSGNPLTASCDYVLSLQPGNQPAWWSLTALEEAADGKATVMSQGIVAEADGSVRLSASRHPQPGNWVAVPRSGRYHLLYTASRETGASAEAVPLFSLVKGSC